MELAWFLWRCQGQRRICRLAESVNRSSYKNMESLKKEHQKNRNSKSGISAFLIHVLFWVHKILHEICKKHFRETSCFWGFSAFLGHSNSSHLYDFKILLYLFHAFLSIYFAYYFYFFKVSKNFRSKIKAVKIWCH